jgi:hypothetical protein
MNYKQACLKPNPSIKTTPIVVEKKRNIEEEEKIEFNKKCAKAVHILYTRWEKYKKDYIELYGEDTYNYMYTVPNYWVMPEDEYDDQEDQEDQEDLQYSSQDDYE